jgi:hypothetical protein
LFTQVLGDKQSVSALQVTSHAAELQMNVPHDCVGGVTHAPAPSQVETRISDELVAQLGSWHLVPRATKAHFPDLHRPVVLQLVGCETAQSSCGSGAPSDTAAHKPSEVERLQAMHAEAQSELQQTP